MAKKTLHEAVKYLVDNTIKINKETSKWKFTVAEIEKQMAVTGQNTIEYHMLNILKNNANSSAQSKV